MLSLLRPVATFIIHIYSTISLNSLFLAGTVAEGINLPYILSAVSTEKVKEVFGQFVGMTKSHIVKLSTIFQILPMYLSW